MGKYTEVRRVAAHQALAKRHPLMTLFGGRVIFVGLFVVAAIVVQHVVTQVDWVIWTIPGLGLGLGLAWLCLWWTGRL